MGTGRLPSGSTLTRGLSSGGIKAPGSQAPKEAWNTLRSINKNGDTPYLSKDFRNDGRNGGQVLPQGVSYTEHDIRASASPKLRGLERIVTGSDGSAWYTSDHYKTFIRMR